MKNDKITAKDIMNEERNILVDKIIELLEKGTLIWDKPWEVIGEFPENPTTKKHYKGMNSIYLMVSSMMKGYTDPRWMTFKQASENGWSVKKGEHGSKIEFFRFYDKKTKKDLDFKMYSKLTSDEKHEYWRENVRTVLKYHTVFNAEQIHGIPEIERKEYKDIIEPVPSLEKLISEWDATVTYDGGNKAYYAPGNDTIHLPPRDAFKSTGGFYGTALHEIGHSTGHKSRLNRDFGGDFGSVKYAKEELVAELISMFMQQETGIRLEDNHMEQHAAYIKSWIKVLKEDKEEFFKAVKEAEKATRFIIGKDAAGDVESDEEYAA